MAQDRNFEILVPVDGSPGSERAVRFVIALHPRLAPLRVRLLNVQLPDTPPRASVADDAHEGGLPASSDEALRSVDALLGAAGVPYLRDSRKGHVPQMIAAYARETGCDAVVMGTRGMGTTDQVLGSIARQVINLVDVPVTLVK